MTSKVIRNAGLNRKRLSFVVVVVDGPARSVGFLDWRIFIFFNLGAG
jgi:hypothetical protein